MSLLHPPSGSPTKSGIRESPTSSIDSGAGGHSPFLHNLQQRFRKSSNASAHSTEQAPPPSSVKSRTDASREAKRYLLSVVRQDWDYPSPPIKRPGSPDHREPISYCRREDGLSDIEPDHSPQRLRSRSNPHKFESPEAVSDYVASSRTKRRRLLQEEMTWNAGLNNWVRQRDTWTGAVKKMPNDTTTSRPGSNNKSHLSPTVHERNTSDSTSDDSLNWLSSPHSLIARDTPENCSSVDSIEFSQPDSKPLTLRLPRFKSKSKSSQSQASSTLQNQPQPQLLTNSTNNQTPNGTAAEDDDVYLPIYPPLFPPTHVLRSRINPSAYPTIYSKIVLQSLAPNIPIPLTHVTRALVEGWKSEGNWPPGATQNPAGLAGTAQDSGLGSIDGGGAKESAFARWRRERSRSKQIQTQPQNQSQEEVQQQQGKRRGSRPVIDIPSQSQPNDASPSALPNQSPPGRVRKSITLVKRAFGVRDDPTPSPNPNSSFSFNFLSPNGTPMAEEEKDIGIDFEEQEDVKAMGSEMFGGDQEREWKRQLVEEETRRMQDEERERKASERDRVLNRGLVEQ